jgi:hypothetical protein
MSKQHRTTQDTGTSENKKAGVFGMIPKIPSTTVELHLRRLYCSTSRVLSPGTKQRSGRNRMFCLQYHILSIISTCRKLESGSDSAARSPCRLLGRPLRHLDDIPCLSSRGHLGARSAGLPYRDLVPTASSLPRR